MNGSGGGEGHQFFAVAAMHGLELVPGLGREAVHVGLETFQTALETLQLLFHLEDAFHAGEVEPAFRHQLLDAAQPLHVRQRVEAGALG